MLVKNRTGMHVVSTLDACDGRFIHRTEIRADTFRELQCGYTTDKPRINILIKNGHELCMSDI